MVRDHTCPILVSQENKPIDQVTAVPASLPPYTLTQFDLILIHPVGLMVQSDTGSVGNRARELDSHGQFILDQTTEVKDHTRLMVYDPLKAHFSQ